MIRPQQQLRPDRRIPCSRRRLFAQLGGTIELASLQLPRVLPVRLCRCAQGTYAKWKEGGMQCRKGRLAAGFFCVRRYYPPPAYPIPVLIERECFSFLLMRTTISAESPLKFTFPAMAN